MSQTTITLKLRVSTVEGKKGSLYIRLTKNRKSRTITTPYKVYREEWNPSKSSVCFDSSNPVRHQYLSGLSADLSRELSELKEYILFLDDTRDFCLEELVEWYFSRNRSRMLSHYVAKLKADLISNGQIRTAIAYQTVLNNILLFNGKQDLSMDKIDARFVRNFELYMRKKGNQENTISFYLRNLRAIYNKAMREKVIGRTTENFFEGACTGVYKTRKRAVKKEVLEKLQNLDLLKEKDKSLLFARDMFFLSFYLRGISFIDLAHLRKKDLSGSVITYTRRKTKQKLEIALTPEIRRIIDYYKNKHDCSEYLLPILQKNPVYSNYQKCLRLQNNRLKHLSCLIGLEAPITTYVARHSWASIARLKGYPVSIISQGLGHNSERTTQIYLDSFDYSILHKANKNIINYTKKAS